MHIFDVDKTNRFIAEGLLLVALRSETIFVFLVSVQLVICLPSVQSMGYTSESLGSNNNQPLLFKTNNIERARITEGGRIGLGTTTPGGWLSIVTKGDGQSNVEDRVSMFLNNTSTSSASSANIHITAGGSSDLTALTHHAPNYSVVNGYSNFGQLASTGAGLILQAKNGILRFETGDNGNGVFERMRITNEGRVGMGIANPEAWLSINAKGDGLSNVEDRTFLSLNNTSTSRASNASLRITAGNDGYFISISNFFIIIKF